MDGEAYYNITREQAERFLLDEFFPPWEELGAQTQIQWDQLAAEKELRSQDNSDRVHG